MNQYLHRNIRKIMLLILLAVFFIIQVIAVIEKNRTYVTVYQNVDYSKVYNYKYYRTHNSDALKNNWNEHEALEYFVNNGMAERQRGCEEFYVIDYLNQNPQLMDQYGDDYKQYYYDYLEE